MLDSLNIASQSAWLSSAFKDTLELQNLGNINPCFFGTIPPRPVLTLWLYCCLAWAPRYLEASTFMLQCFILIALNSSVIFGKIFIALGPCSSWAQPGVPPPSLRQAASLSAEPSLWLRRGDVPHLRFALGFSQCSLAQSF